MKTNSTRTMRAEDWTLLRHFTAAEFKRPEKMGYQYMLALDALAEQAGVPLRVSSDSRSPERNKAVGGAKDSAHCDDICEATDLAPKNNAERFEIIRAAILNGWTRIGIYKDGSLHVDGTDGRRPARRLWVIVQSKA